MLDAANSLRVAGRLVADPGDLADDFPFGGTALGLTSTVAFRGGGLIRPNTATELGGVTVEVFRTGESPVLVCVFRGLPSAAVSTVFPNVAGGVVQYPGDTAPGGKESERAIKLLFAAEDAANHPSILLYNAVPMPDDADQLALAIGREAGMAAVFIGIPDSNGFTAERGLLASLTLNPT